MSCGIHLQSRGYRVMLLDPRGLGNGASYGNAAIIANSACLPVATPGTLRRVPSMLLSRDGPLHIRPAYLPALLPWLARFVAASRPARVAQISRALSALLRPSVEAPARGRARRHRRAHQAHRLAEGLRVGSRVRAGESGL